MAQGLWPRISRRLIDMLEMPKDVFMDLPKATVLGAVQAIFENHKGVVEYNPQRIRIRTSIGEVLVTGRGLKIGAIASNELVVDGRIESVSFSAREGRS